MSYLGTKNFLIEVAKGNVAGHSIVHKFGFNDSISTTLSPVCSGGFYRTPTGTVTLAVISTNTNDTAAGTGAREVTIEYLDTNFVEQTATMATNGTTESTETVAGVKRLLRLYVSSSGTYATQSTPSQLGDLTVQVSGGGDVWAVIPQLVSGFGAGQSLIGAYTVPAGKTAYLLSTEFSSDISGTKVADFYFFKREGADDTSTPYSGIMRIQETLTGTQGWQQQEHFTQESYPEKTDVGFLAKASASSEASVSFELLLIDN